MYENESKISITIAAYLVDLSSSSVPTMTESLRPGVLMILFSMCWILVEKSMSPPACPILRELKSAVCAPQSRTATRGEGWAWCVRGCRAHHATVTTEHFVSQYTMRPEIYKFRTYLIHLLLPLICKLIQSE